MKKMLTNLDIANIISYINAENSIANDTTRKFTIEFAWKFKKNIQKLSSGYEIFTKLRDEISSSYSSDEYSYEKEDGTRFVKDEYIQEYQTKINELLIQTNDYDIDMINIEKLCAGEMDKVELSIPEFNVLSFMIDDSITEASTITE